MAFGVAACATPHVTLRPQFVPGEERTYRLDATAEVSAELPGLAGTQTIRLVATAVIEVVGHEADGARLRVALRPERLERDGTAVPPPEPQRAEIIVGPDGRVVRLARVEGAPPGLAGAGIEDLVPLLGVPMPEGRVRVGERWALPVGAGEPAGVVRGRLAGLRVVDGYDTAIVAASVERPVSRRQTVAGRRVRLQGGETGVSEIAFAFREGVAVRVVNRSEARMDLAGEGGETGTIVVRSRSTLSLRALARPDAA